MGDPWSRARFDADHAVCVLHQILPERAAAPELVRTDNAPETTANAVRDWCRLDGAASLNEQPERTTARLS